MDAISIINSEGVLLFENKQHKDLFKSFPDENKNRNYFNLITEDDIEKFKSEFKMIHSLKSNLYITLRFFKNEKDIFWGELSIKKFVDSEEQILFMCVLRDITFRKQIEDELKKRVYELEKYNQLMIGREIRMVELKKEVNSLCKQFGLPVRYSEDDI
jgi:PAS domain S-box-containing protein